MIEAVIFFGGGLAWVTALGQLVRKIDSRNLIFGGFFFCLGALQINSCLIRNGQILEVPFLLLLQSPLILWIAPLLYLYFQTMIADEFHFTLRQLVHFLPGLLTLSFLAVKFQEPGALSLLARAYLERSGNTILKPILIVSVIYVIAYIAYFAQQIWKLRDAGKRTPQGQSGSGRRNFIIGVAATSLVMTGIAAAALFLDVKNPVRLLNLAASLIIIAYSLAAQRHPFLMNQLAEEVKQRYRRSQLQNVDLGDLEQRLVRLMEDEKIYCDEDLTLPRLAETLDVSSHQLSQFLNERLSKNFNSFLNEYRIRDACVMIAAEPDRTILSIGMAVGFNSNSAFHAAFQKATGMSPGKYRKQGKT